MDEDGFQKFLKRSGGSSSVTERCVRCVRDFSVRDFKEHLLKFSGDRGLKEASSEDLESFVEWIERKPKASAKKHLWALKYNIAYISK